MPTDIITSQIIRVLLVEDSPTEAMLIEAALADNEDVLFDVCHTICLKDTQLALKQQSFDIVVLDLTLPECSGMETFTRLHASCPTVPVVILTANASKTIALESVKQGAQDYILKEQIENMQLSMSLRYAIERKKAEESLKKAQQDVEEAYSELQKTQAQLVQNEKLASIGQLAAGVAHEMNTPLGFISSNIQTLKSYINKFKDIHQEVIQLCDQIGQSNLQPIQEKAEAIQSMHQKLKIDFILQDAHDLVNESQEGLDTVAEIVQSLRDFTRIDQAESYSEYDLNHAWESTLVMAKSELKDINVETHLGEIPSVYCNPTQINEIFLSVTRNAIEAFETSSQDTPQLTIQTSLVGDRVVSKIQDNGPGIADDVLAHVFDPFFTTKAVGAGKGLGLSSAHDIIVTKHQGKIDIETLVGQGTTVSIELPICKANNLNDPQTEESHESY